MFQSWRWFAIAALAAAGFPYLAVAQDEPRRPQDRGRQNPAELLRRLDGNGDGQLDRGEIPERMKQRFEQMDRDGDGKLSRQELQRAAGLGGQPAPQPPAGGNRLLRLLDANGDGELSKGEVDNAAKALQKLDMNEDGKVDRDELSAIVRSGAGGGRQGEVNTPPAKGERHADKLQVGDVAPDFNLPLVSGRGEVTLSSFQNRRPVVLIFASYT